MTTNLLVNPGAEAGNVSGWTVGGDGTPVADAGTFDSGITPHTGMYDFLGHDGAAPTLSQTAQIVTGSVTTDLIDGGTLYANISFWEQGLSQGAPSDSASVTLVFLDSTGATLGTVNTGEADNHAGVWGNVSDAYPLPVGTRSITYTMTFVRHQGSDNDAFVDDNVLRIATSDGLQLSAKSLSFGNEMVGGVTAAQVVTASNPNATTVNIAQIALDAGANPSEFAQTNNCPAALVQNASCQISITFTPHSVGFKTAGIIISTDSVPSQQGINFDGTGLGGILQVNPGNLKTVAGNGTAGYSGDGGPATAAEFIEPGGIAFDPAGNLYITDVTNAVIRKVDTSGNISTFAGTGTAGYSGDGGPATSAELNLPFTVNSDTAGNIYIQDTGNNVIRKVNTSGIITTFAGTGVAGHAGDGGPAINARFNQNQGARFDNNGNLYVPQCAGASIRKIDTSGNISTVAGNFTEGFSGDGGPAINAQLQCPSGVAIDSVGNLYIADDFNNRIRKVDTSGIITTIAGNDNAAFSGDGGPATAAELSLPNDVQLDGAGNLYIADSGNNRVRKIDTNGIITTAAGGLNNAGSAGVNTPLNVTVDASGNLFFADSGNNAVREVFPAGVAPFPATPVGTAAAPQTLTLSNIGNVPIVIQSAQSFSLSGNAGDFSLSGGTCLAGVTLPVGQGSCTLQISFTPTVAGARSLTVSIVDDALNSPQSFTIGGTGTAVQQTPVLTWATPAPITVNTPLSATQLDAVATDANGATVLGTYEYTPPAGTFLEAGTQTLSVLFTPTDNTAFTTATKTVSIVVTQASAGATTTTLAVTSGGAAATTVTAESVVTLTATVAVGTALVHPGQVAFCDANAATCTDIHLLGTAQLLSTGTGAGTATYRFVPGIGSHSYKAVFLGTTAAVGSASSAAALAVTGTYPTATTIAQSGTAGNYTLTATTVGTGSSTVAPTGTVSFLDTSNANGVIGSGALGASTAAFSLVQATGSPDAVGGGAYGVATGDFNGDGFADVVVENYSAGTVSVLLGKGDGTFQPQVTYAVGTLPERVLTVDLNGDGNLDLVVANTGSSTISVLLGNGDGTFQDQVTYAAGSPVGLGVMDVNHDGIPDVVAGDYYENTMSVLLGNGDGTLQAAVTYPTRSTPQTVAEGDFNGDGNVDVAVGNEGGASVGVLLGNGDGTFQTITTYAVGNSPQGLQVGDFNADGKQDLAVANEVDGTISVLLGNGDGTFQTQVTYPVGVQPVGIAIADFNGDGIDDITVGNTGQASLTQGVLLGKGDGTFQPQMTFPTGNFPYGVAVADFNGDGLPDMAVANFADATATILLSQTTEAATATATVASVTAGTHQVVASYPGDTNYKASVSQATALIGTTSTPVITWTPAVATIPYGTPLGASQLNATAATAAGTAIPGTFTYTPPAGTVLAPGAQTLSVAFTPTDGADYTAAAGTVQLMVTGLNLVSFAPTGAKQGDASTTITLMGSGFVPSSVVLVNGTAVATTYVNLTTLTAVIPAASLTQTGTLQIAVSDPSIQSVSTAQAFSVIPATTSATLTGPSSTPPGSQPTVTLTLTEPYPLPITAVFSLSFAGAATPPVDDPAIQFAAGGRTLTVVIPANSTTVPVVQLQSGTDAGTITVPVVLTADGLNITPATLVPLTIVVPPAVPVLTSATLTRSGKQLTVAIHGFSNTREVSQADFHFKAATNATIAKPDFTLPATTLFGGWYSSDASDVYGSTFTYMQIFDVNDDAANVGSVEVTLTNSVGASDPQTTP